MIAFETSLEPEVRSGFETELTVDPADISFLDLAGDSVLIRVRIRNEGEQYSQPTVMRLESAPLGAFVPWRPLAVIPVPMLEPGESRELSTVVSRLRPAVLGSFDRVPPRTVLTAVNASPDEPSSSLDPGVAAMVDLIRGRARVDKGASLAPDLLEMVGRSKPHWAGNINVFVGVRAVERHVARSLRIYPGRPNLAMFIVGEPGQLDAYAFELAGLSRGWRAGLYDVTTAKTLVVGTVDAPVKETEWVESPGGLMITLAVHPPADCTEGNVEVHVTRRSSQKTAVVEFNLDAAAQGTGCYQV